MFLLADGHVEWQEQKLWESGNWPQFAGSITRTDAGSA